MRSTRKTLTHLLTVAASAVLMVTALAAPSTAGADTDSPRDLTSAAADEVPEIGETFNPAAEMSSSDVCMLGWCFSGGVHWSIGRAHSRMQSQYTASNYYAVWFSSDGETLYLTDSFSDGYYARADVVVTDPDTHVVLDRDTSLYTGTSRWINLGTPDGSGDIAEDLDVSFRVCRGDGKPCSPWITARS